MIEHVYAIHAMLTMSNRVQVKWIYGDSLKNDHHAVTPSSYQRVICK